MAFTYSGDPSKSDLEKIRFLVGDTDPQQALLQDEEILFLLEQFPDPEVAAIEACARIVAKLSKEIDYAIGPERVAARQRYLNYRALYNSLVSNRRGRHAAPTWTDQCNPPRPFAFNVGMHDYKRWN